MFDATAAAGIAFMVATTCARLLSHPVEVLCVLTQYEVVLESAGVV
jgi:hypothetical protein